MNGDPRSRPPVLMRQAPRDLHSDQEGSYSIGNLKETGTFETTIKRGERGVL
ncbi:hypothetical protein M408DRAFT_326007 [Serendipita vermifera MAFF 305830]|uniref:Uncharacterized protein n=1 Tax=Serendipita vermifera MAFF 305830 TaxID=933852 RepID=A0A0C3B8T2_SERVB|nr:hypothetical protein M408DRAFT_326007 [Serendipita vermifera MAFF 305830]